MPAQFQLWKLYVSKLNTIKITKVLTFIPIQAMISVVHLYSHISYFTEYYTFEKNV